MTQQLGKTKRGWPKGMPKSEEHKRKMSESLTRYLRKLEEAGLIHPLVGKPQSEELKKKRLESLKITFERLKREKTIEGPIIKVATRKNGVLFPTQWLGKVVKCSAVIEGNIVEIIKEVKPKGNYSCVIHTPKSWAGMQVISNIIEDTEGIVLTPKRGRPRSKELEQIKGYATIR